MLTPLIESIFAGICVSVINKLFLNSNSILYKLCEEDHINHDVEDLSASTNTTISDMISEPHIHIHT